MDRGIFVPSETDKADLAGFLRLECRFEAAARTKNALRIAHANNFVELEKINMVGLESAQRLVDLQGGGLFGLAVNFGHEKGLLPVAITQRLAHAKLALPTIVVPAVVQKIDAALERGADNAYTFLLIGLDADMVTAQADHRDAFPGATQATIGNSIFCACRPEIGRCDAGEKRSGKNTVEEFATRNTTGIREEYRVGNVVHEISTSG